MTATPIGCLYIYWLWQKTTTYLLILQVHYTPWQGGGEFKFKFLFRFCNHAFVIPKFYPNSWLRLKKANKSFFFSHFLHSSIQYALSIIISIIYWLIKCSRIFKILQVTTELSLIITLFNIWIELGVCTWFIALLQWLDCNRYVLGLSFEFDIRKWCLTLVAYLIEGWYREGNFIMYARVQLVRSIVSLNKIVFCLSQPNQDVSLHLFCMWQLFQYRK